MKFETLKYDIEEGIGVLTISRPKALNALNRTVLEEMNAFFETEEGNKDLRALIITGDGEKAFVAGADIKEIDGLTASSAKSFADYGQKLFSRIENCRVPVVAAINGFALGGGLELALACDFIYASSNAKMGLPECTLGIMPGFGGTVRLARRIGPSYAKELTFTGNMLTAAEAHTAGLVNCVTDPGNLLPKVRKVCSTMALRAPLALTAIKKSIQSTYGLKTEKAMDIERDAFAGLFSSKDQKEGTKAFIEKRQPEFVGA